MDHSCLQSWPTEWGPSGLAPTNWHRERSKQSFVSRIESFESKYKIIKILINIIYGILGLSNSEFGNNWLLAAIVTQNVWNVLQKSINLYRNSIVFGNTDSVFIKSENYKEISSKLNELSNVLIPNLTFEHESTYRWIFLPIHVKNKYINLKSSISEEKLQKINSLELSNQYLESLLENPNEIIDEKSIELKAFNIHTLPKYFQQFALMVSHLKILNVSFNDNHINFIRQKLIKKLQLKVKSGELLDISSSVSKSGKNLQIKTLLENYSEFIEETSNKVNFIVILKNNQKNNNISSRSWPIKWFYNDDSTLDISKINQIDYNHLIKPFDRICSFIWTEKLSNYQKSLIIHESQLIQFTDEIDFDCSFIPLVE